MPEVNTRTSRVDTSFHDEGYGYDIFGLHPPTLERTLELCAPLYDPTFVSAPTGSSSSRRMGPRSSSRIMAACSRSTRRCCASTSCASSSRRGSRARSPTTSCQAAGREHAVRALRCRQWHARERPLPARTRRAASRSGPRVSRGPGKRFRDRYRHPGLASRLCRARDPASCAGRAGRDRRRRRELAARDEARHALVRCAVPADPRVAAATPHALPDPVWNADRPRTAIMPPAMPTTPTIVAAAAARVRDVLEHQIEDMRMVRRGSVPMRVMVTGATAPLGRAVVERLLAEPEVELVLADRPRSGATVERRRRSSRGLSQRGSQAPARGPRSDPRPGPPTWRSTPSSTPRSIGTRTTTGAASTRRTSKSTRALLQSCNEQSTIRRFVYRSFAEVYAQHHATTSLIDEDAPLEFDPTVPQWLRDRVEADLTACAHHGGRCRSPCCAAPSSLRLGTGSQLWDYLSSRVCLRPAGFDPIVNVLSIEDAATALVAGRSVDCDRRVQHRRRRHAAAVARDHARATASTFRPRHGDGADVPTAARRCRLRVSLRPQRSPVPFRRRARGLPRAPRARLRSVDPGAVAASVVARPVRASGGGGMRPGAA